MVRVCYVRMVIHGRLLFNVTATAEGGNLLTLVDKADGRYVLVLWMWLMVPGTIQLMLWLWMMVSGC